jgi:endogenous inhibitor of DNA gyrase (YacG/DUF329 family)
MMISCPLCKKETAWEDNPFRPFCSERCRLIDLGKWAAEEYRVAGEEQSLPDDGEDEKNRSEQ